MSCTVPEDVRPGNPIEQSRQVLESLNRRFSDLYLWV